MTYDLVWAKKATPSLFLSNLLLFVEGETFFNMYIKLGVSVISTPVAAIYEKYAS